MPPGHWKHAINNEKPFFEGFKKMVQGNFSTRKALMPGKRRYFLAYIFMMHWFLIVPCSCWFEWRYFYCSMKLSKNFSICKFTKQCRTFPFSLSVGRTAYFNRSTLFISITKSQTLSASRKMCSLAVSRLIWGDRTSLEVATLDWDV